MLGSLFSKVGLLASSYIKKGLQHRCFLRNLRKFLRTLFMKNICERLLLSRLLGRVKVKKITQRSFSIIISKGSGKGQKQPTQCFMKKTFLKNFAIFTGTHLCWSLFLIKLIKKRLQHRCFPVNIA